MVTVELLPDELHTVPDVRGMGLKGGAVPARKAAACACRSRAGGSVRTSRAPRRGREGRGERCGAHNAEITKKRDDT